MQDRWTAWSNGARQRASAYWRDILESDPELESAFVTVELIIGNHRILLAREPIQTTRGSTGEVMTYLPGLMREPAVNQGISLGNQAASARSVSFEVPAFLVDAPAVLASGHMLAGVGEIAVQTHRGDYDLRWVLLRGSITSSPGFGGSNETASFTLTDMRGLQERKLPNMVVNGTTWPLAQDAAVGERIPRVFNGAVALPAHRVRDDHGSSGLYFAACDTPDDFDVDAVYVNGDATASGDPTYGWSEATVQDGLGRRVLVTNHSASSGPWANNDAVNISLTRASGVVPKSVIQIARELLSEYSGLGPLGLNLDLFSYAETRMEPTSPSVVINASGQDAPGVLQFVEQGLLMSFPMVHMLYAGAGLGAMVIDRRTGPGRKGLTGEMVGGRFPLIDRLTEYTESAKGDLYTDFEVRYGYNPIERGYSGIVTRDPSTSAGCSFAARVIGGRRPYETIESPYIVSATEAAYVADWLVAHRTVPAYTVTWACFPWVHMNHRPGENILFTDPEFSVFTDTTATIIDMGFERGAHTITLLVWHPVLALSLTALPGM